MFILLKGCIIFDTLKPTVCDVFTVEKFNTLEEAENNGNEYLFEDNADSYMIIENESDVEWVGNSFEKYKDLKNV